MQVKCYSSNFLMIAKYYSQKYYGKVLLRNCVTLIEKENSKFINPKDMFLIA